MHSNGTSFEKDEFRTHLKEYLGWKESDGSFNSKRRDKLSALLGCNHNMLTAWVTGMARPEVSQMLVMMDCLRAIIEMEGKA